MPSVMTGRSRSRARWSVIARTDSRAPLGRQRDRHSGSGDRAGSRLRVKHRRIAVSRNGDPDSKRAPGRSGENVGRVQHAKDNDQSPHALAPGGRSPVRKCGGAVPRRDGSVRRQARDRDICPGAARAGPVSSVASAMAFSISARIPLWPRKWNKTALYAFIYVLELRENK